MRFGAERNQGYDARRAGSTGRGRSSSFDRAGHATGLGPSPQIDTPSENPSRRETDTARLFDSGAEALTTTPGRYLESPRSIAGVRVRLSSSRLSPLVVDLRNILND